MGRKKASTVRGKDRSKVKSKRRTRSRQQKPSKKSLLNDIQEISNAIKGIGRVSNLSGTRAIFTMLYGEKRYAEKLLERHYPSKAKVGSVSKRRKMPAAATPEVKPTTKSEKLKRGWRFIDAVKKNYSNDPTISKMSKKQLRSEFKKFRQGRESKVPDIAWYNPSP